MQCNDGFPRTGRTSHSCGATVGALNQSALCWMEEDNPFVPGIVEGAFEFFKALDHPEAAPGVWIDRRDQQVLGERRWV